MNPTAGREVRDGGAGIPQDMGQGAHGARRGAGSQAPAGWLPGLKVCDLRVEVSQEELALSCGVQHVSATLSDNREQKLNREDGHRSSSANRYPK